MLCTVVRSSVFLLRHCILGKAQFLIWQPNKTTAPRLQPPFKALCWLILTQTFLTRFQPYRLSYTLEAAKSEHWCHQQVCDALRQGCNKLIFSCGCYVLWNMQAGQSAESQSPWFYWETLATLWNLTPDVQQASICTCIYELHLTSNVKVSLSLINQEIISWLFLKKKK